MLFLGLLSAVYIFVALQMDLGKACTLSSSRMPPLEISLVCRMFVQVGLGSIVCLSGSIPAFFWQSVIIDSGRT